MHTDCDKVLSEKLQKYLASLLLGEIGIDDVPSDFFTDEFLSIIPSEKDIKDIVKIKKCRITDARYFLENNLPSVTEDSLVVLCVVARRKDIVTNEHND